MSNLILLPMEQRATTEAMTETLLEGEEFNQNV